MGGQPPLRLPAAQGYLGSKALARWIAAIIAGLAFGVTAVAAPAGLRSDEFDSQLLDTTIWQFSDPLGDSELAMSGSHAVISVPYGSAHDLWEGSNHAPRLLQEAADQDFEVELSFDSPVEAPYQLQGVVVEQDALNLVRVEFHHNGMATQIFVATFVGGAPTIRHWASVADGSSKYLRLLRSGSTWMVSYSTDGTEWATAVVFDHEIRVTKLGPFAGNMGSPPPAFASRVDYFRVLSEEAPPEEPPPPPSDTTPPVLSGVGASVGLSSATVTWGTDEPADSRVEYGSTAGYGESRSDASLATSHSVSLSGLACETTYHYRVSSADAAGNRATGQDATFTTGGCPSGSGSLRSEEFEGDALDASVWRVFDPLGDSSVSVASGQLRLSVPAGSAHDLWEGRLDAPRVLQTVADGDFEAEAKYDVAVTQPLQSQGLVAQADVDDFVRFDVYSTGGGTRVFGATFVGGRPTIRVNEEIAGGAPLYLRMQREGSTWTLSYSLTGSIWTTAASFSFQLALSELGPFAGNMGSPPPAFASRVDYFRVLSEEAPPEEPPPPPSDTTPPVLSGVGASVGLSSATVTWGTDEPADSRVEYGSTAGYGESRSDASLATSHSVSLSGLACETTYHYRVSSADAAGNRATGQDATFTTTSCAPSDGPEIDVWYGDSQRFGDPGFPQRWLNILGKAFDPDSLLWIDYRLDNGPRIRLVHSPEANPRINEYGDFNIQLDRLALTAGRHIVTIIASDGLGNESTRVVEVLISEGASWPLPYETDWAVGIQQAVQVVDGHWAIEGDGLRTVVPGYDRLLAVGDETWTSVDVTVPVTVHALDASSPHSGIGVAAGWRGHEGGANEPWTGWPLGGLCFYYRIEPKVPYQLFLFEYGWPPYSGTDQRTDWLEPGGQYIFRLRAQPVDAQSSRYSCKIWPAADAEPSEWGVSQVLPTRAGSVLLVADYADVTFGPITVRE